MGEHATLVRGALLMLGALAAAAGTYFFARQLFSSSPRSANRSLRALNATQHGKRRSSVPFDGASPQQELPLVLGGKKSAKIVLFDIETTVPAKSLIEFGAIVFDRVSFEEHESYSTFVQPHSDDAVSRRSVAINHITAEMLKDAPTFEQISERLYEMLHGRVWMGHNILSFDNKIIQQEFERIGRPVPRPAKLVDTLPLLRKSFGQRAGNLKISGLAEYFCLGPEPHRALYDCRMTLEVLKCCALTLLLETHDLEITSRKSHSAVISGSSTEGRDGNIVDESGVNSKATPPSTSVPLTLSSEQMSTASDSIVGANSSRDEDKTAEETSSATTVPSGGKTTKAPTVADTHAVTAATHESHDDSSGSGGSNTHEHTPLPKEASSLTPSKREVYKLFQQSKLPITEIAVIRGIQPATVEAYLADAIATNLPVDVDRLDLNDDALQQIHAVLKGEEGIRLGALKERLPTYSWGQLRFAIALYGRASK